MRSARLVAGGIIVGILVFALVLLGMRWAEAGPDTTRYEKVRGARWMAQTVKFNRCDNITDLTHVEFYAQVDDELLILRCPR